MIANPSIMHNRSIHLFNIDMYGLTMLALKNKYIGSKTAIITSRVPAILSILINALGVIADKQNDGVIVIIAEISFGYLNLLFNCL